MKIFNKVLAMVLALIMTVAVLPLGVFAADPWIDVDANTTQNAAGTESHSTIVVKVDAKRLAEILKSSGISNDLLHQIKDGISIDIDGLLEIMPVEDILEIITPEEIMNLPSFDLEALIDEFGDDLDVYFNLGEMLYSLTEEQINELVNAENALPVILDYYKNTDEGLAGLLEQLLGDGTGEDLDGDHVPDNCPIRVHELANATFWNNHCFTDGIYDLNLENYIGDGEGKISLDRFTAYWPKTPGGEFDLSFLNLATDIKTDDFLRFAESEGMHITDYIELGTMLSEHPELVTLVQNDPDKYLSATGMAHIEAWLDLAISAKGAWVEDDFNLDALKAALGVDDLGLYDLMQNHVDVIEAKVQEDPEAYLSAATYAALRDSVLTSSNIKSLASEIDLATLRTDAAAVGFTDEHFYDYVRLADFIQADFEHLAHNLDTFLTDSGLYKAHHAVDAFGIAMEIGFDNIIRTEGLQTILGCINLEEVIAAMEAADENLSNYVYLTRAISIITANKLVSIVMSSDAELGTLINLDKLFEIVEFEMIVTQLMESGKVADLLKMDTIKALLSDVATLALSKIPFIFDEITVNGKVVAAEDPDSISGRLAIDFRALVKELAKAIPTLDELATLEDNKLISLDLGLTYKNAENEAIKKDFTIEIVLDSGAEYVREAAGQLSALLRKYIDFSITDNNTVVLDIKVPAKVTSLYAKVLATDKLPESIRQKILALPSKTGNDAVAYLEDLTLAEIVEVLDKVEPTELYNKFMQISYVEKVLAKIEAKTGYDLSGVELETIVNGADKVIDKASAIGVVQQIYDKIEAITGIDVTGVLDNADIDELYQAALNKAAGFEGRFNQVKNYILYAVDYVDAYAPGALTTAIGDLYKGNGVFNANAYISKDVNARELAERIINKICSKIDLPTKVDTIVDFVLSYIPEELSIKAGLDLTVRFSDLYRVTYRDVYGETVFDTFLPAGTALSIYTGYTAPEGVEVDGWVLFGTETVVDKVTGDMTVEPNVISGEIPMINVTVNLKGEDGQIQTTTYEVAVGRTVREFIEKDLYQGEYTFEELAALYEILLNGVAANADAVLKDGDVIDMNLIETPGPEPTITVTVNIKGKDGQIQTATYEVAIGRTVRQFIEEDLYQGEYTFEELAALYNILLNGVAANADTVLHDGDVIDMNLIETPGPEPTITVTVNVKGTDGQIQSATYEVAIGRTVRQILEEDFYQGAYTFEELAALYNILLNGVATNADTVLHDGDVINLTPIYYTVKFMNGNKEVYSVLVLKNAKLGDVEAITDEIWKDLYKETTAHVGKYDKYLFDYVVYWTTDGQTEIAIDAIKAMTVTGDLTFYAAFEEDHHYEGEGEATFENDSYVVTVAPADPNKMIVTIPTQIKNYVLDHPDTAKWIVRIVDAATGVAYDKLTISGETLKALYQEGDSIGFGFDKKNTFNYGYYNQGNSHVYDLAFYVDGDLYHHDFNSGDVVIQLPFADAVSGREDIKTLVHYVNDAGERTLVPSTVTANGNLNVLTFSPEHFSYYVVANEYRITYSFNYNGTPVEGELAGFDQTTNSAYYPAGAMVCIAPAVSGYTVSDVYYMNDLGQKVVIPFWNNDTTIKWALTVPAEDVELVLDLAAKSYYVYYYVKNAQGVYEKVAALTTKYAADADPEVVKGIINNAKTTIEAMNLNIPYAYKLGGWVGYDETLLGSADMNVYLIFAPVQYTVNFKGADGSIVDTIVFDINSVKSALAGVKIPEVVGYVGSCEAWDNLVLADEIAKMIAAGTTSMELTINYTKVVYQIIHDGSTVTVGGTASYGDEITLNVIDKPFYTATVTVVTIDGTAVPVVDGKFTMPASTVTVTVTYAINADMVYTINGKPFQVSEVGEIVTFAVYVLPGYEVTALPAFCTLIDTENYEDGIVKRVYSFQITENNMAVDYEVKYVDYDLVQIINGKKHESNEWPEAKERKVDFLGWSDRVAGAIEFAMFVKDTSVSLVWLWILLAILLIIALIILIYRLYVKGKVKSNFIVRFVLWIVGGFFAVCLFITTVGLFFASLFGKKDEDFDYEIEDEDASADETVEEAAEEVAEEVAEEAAEETSEEATEEAVEEVAEEATEEAVEEVAEEATEEVAEEAAEEAAEDGEEPKNV